MSAYWYLNPNLSMKDIAELEKHAEGCRQKLLDTFYATIEESRDLPWDQQQEFLSNQIQILATFLAIL